MVVFHGLVVADEIKEEMNPATQDFLLQAITLPFGVEVTVDADRRKLIVNEPGVS